MADKPKKKIFNFFWNNIPKEEEIEEEKINADGDSSVVEIDGKQIPLKELIDVYLKEQEEKKQEEVLANVIKPEDEIDIGDGKKVTAQELISCYQKNASKMNQIEEEEKKKKEEEKPDENFKSLENAVNKSIGGIKLMIDTKDDRIKRGKEKYGSGEGK